MTVDRQTTRWYGISAIAFLSAAVGIIASKPGLLLAGSIGVGYVAYANSGAPPAVELSVERSLSDPEPDPGEQIKVTLRIENEGGFLPDLRVLDGVPVRLAVSAGSPRIGTSLRTDKVAEFSYYVTAERGEHTFDPVTIIARDISGANERELTIESASDTTIRCAPSYIDSSVTVPLRGQTTRYAGQVATNDGGAGIEFFATREYRPGDAMNRIDWNRLARTGELSTLEYRRERSATIVLLIDARESAYVGGRHHAVERSVAAAGQIFVDLLGDGHQVGLATLGEEPCWLGPSTGEAHSAEAMRMLAFDPSISPMPPTETILVTRRVRRLRSRLPEDTQLFLFTPLADDYITTIAARFEAYGHAVTVVSPDIMKTETPGQRLARTERRTRITQLRAGGLRVIDWERDVPLTSVLANVGVWG
ncbi:MAG: DUF58 domain-containing protein [Halobacteriales archaeon]|nr:DUF58 domain-containing protein [Halobacteriales archaeon]